MGQRQGNRSGCLEADLVLPLWGSLRTVSFFFFKQLPKSPDLVRETPKLESNFFAV